MFNGPLQTNLFQPLHKASTKAMGDIGTLYIDAEGNAWRYCKAGASALGKGKLGLAPAAVAHHINKAPAADVAVGATSLNITVGATAVTADQYAGGFLQVNDGTAEGKQYRIQSNTACGSAGTTTVTLAEPVVVAMTNTGSEVSLIPSPYNGVIESTTAANLPVGVAMCDAPAASFYWAQTRGIACTLIDGTPAVGAWVVPGSVAGSVSAASATIATTVANPIVGQMFATAGVTTEYKPVKLIID